MLRKIKELFKQKTPNTSVTDELNAMLQSEKYDEVIAGSEKLLLNEDKAIVKEGCKLIGTSLFRTNKYQEALPYMQRVAEYNPAVIDWFNVLSAATFAKNIEVANKAFEQALQMQIISGHKEEPSIPVIRQYYAHALCKVGEFKLALEQINELRKIYEELQITDTHFLYIRGVPCLTHTMEIAIDIFKGLGEEFKAEEWIDDFALKLDEEGQEYLKDVKSRL